MTKIDIAIGIVAGFMLGTMALVILSFYIFTNKKVELIKLRLEYEGHKQEIIEGAKGICSTSYKVIVTTILENGTIEVECKME